MWTARLIRIAAVAAGMAANAAAFGSGVTFTPVLVQGQQAPGKPGYTIKLVGDVPLIGDSGHVAMDFVQLSGPGISEFTNYFVGYTGLAGSLTIFQEGGMPAGTLGPDVQFKNAFSSNLSIPNAAGDFVFTHPVLGTGVDSSNDFVVFAYRGGATSVLFRESTSLPQFPNGEFLTETTSQIARILDNGNLLAQVDVKGGPGGVAVQNNLLTGPVAAPAVRLAWGVPPPGCTENLTLLSNWYVGTNFSPAGKFIVRGTLAGVPTTSDDAFWTGDANGASLWFREGGSLPGINPPNVVKVQANEFYGPTINDAGEALAMLRLQVGVGDATNDNDEILVHGAPGSLNVLVRENEQAPGLPAGVLLGNAWWFSAYNGGVVLGADLRGSVSETNNEVVLAGPPGSLNVMVRKGDPAPGFPTGYTFGTFAFNTNSVTLHANGHFALQAIVNSDAGNLRALYACAPGLAPQLVCAWDNVLEVAPGDLRKVSHSISPNASRGSINAHDQITFRADFTDGSSAMMIASVSFGGASPSVAAGAAPTISDSAGNANGTPDPAESLIGLTIPVRNGGTLGATGVTATLTSLTPTVTVQTANAAYPDLAAGASGASNATPFVISVSPSHPCGSNINLKLHVTSAEGTNDVNLIIPTGRTYPGCAVFAVAPPTVMSDTPGNGNGNGVADPGESAIALTIPVTKTGGGGPSTGVSATLTTTTATASIVTGVAAYPNIAAAATQSNSTPFVIALSPSHPCGAPVNLHLSVSADGGLGVGEMDLAINGGVPAATTPTLRSGIGAGIPDNDANGVTANFVVSGMAVPISDVNFRFDGSSTSTSATIASTGLGHANVGELVISLTSPDPDGAGPIIGTTVVLANHPGPDSTANNLRQCMFDDSAASSIQTIGSPVGPITGSFQPLQPLSVFNGLSGAAVNGTWVLRVADTVASINGVANGQGGFVRNATLFISNVAGCTPPDSCLADFNHSGGLEVQDIFDYLNAWFAGSAAADFNGGGLAVQDIFDYLNAWFAGC